MWAKDDEVREPISMPHHLVSQSYFKLSFAMSRIFKMSLRHFQLANQVPLKIAG